MAELVIINRNDNTALARNIYNYVYEGQEKRQAFAHWFNRLASRHGFTEGRDYVPIWAESTGGRPSVDYVVSLDMAKELCMVASTTNGRKARRYFIACESALEQGASSIDAPEQGSEEYKKLIYDVCGLAGKQESYNAMMKARGLKADDFKWSLSEDELKRICYAESIIMPLIELGKRYSEIKQTLKPVFDKKGDR